MRNLGFFMNPRALTIKMKYKIKDNCKSLTIIYSQIAPRAPQTIYRPNQNVIFLQIFKNLSKKNQCKIKYNIEL